jgi:hypothetical protein
MVGRVSSEIQREPGSTVDYKFVTTSRTEPKLLTKRALNVDFRRFFLGPRLNAVFTLAARLSTCHCG